MGQQHPGSTPCCCAWHQGSDGSVHGAQVAMRLSSCWWAEHLAQGYFQKKAGEEECRRGMVAWAQPSGKLRVSAAQGTVQDLALAAQKHAHPPLMPILQPLPSPGAAAASPCLALTPWSQQSSCGSARPGSGWAPRWPPTHSPVHRIGG